MKTIITTLLIVFNLTTFGQKIYYTVVNVDGDIKFETAKNQILIGTKVNEGDTLRVTKGFLILKCSTKDTVRIDQPGVYVINQRMCKIGKSSPDLLWLIAHQLFETLHPEDPNEWRKHLKIVGGIHRAQTECSCAVDDNLQVVYFFDGMFDLHWDCNKLATPLMFDLYLNTAKNKKEISVPVTSNRISLKDITKQLKKGTTYYWNVKNDKSCKEFSVLHYVSELEYKTIQKSISTTVKGLVKTKAEQFYLMGVLYESKHYYADAYFCYKAASTASVKTIYKTNLKEYKIKYSLD